MNAPKVYTPDSLLEMIAKLVCETSGVEFTEKVRSRVEVQTKRRSVELGLHHLGEYIAYFQMHEKAELKLLIAHLTRHSSPFFGEFSHFEYIAHFVLKTLVPEIRKRPDKTLQVWSTACSRGQEAYSLAMYLKQALTLYGTDLQVKVTGTDSELDAIKVSQAGMYPRGEMRDIPLQFLGNDWERVTVNGTDFMRAKSALKQLVHFEYANLLGLKAKFPGQKFDIIFARNVFSYFNESEIKLSCLELLNRLHRNGHLLVGLSESLQGLGLPLQMAGPSVYQLKNADLIETLILNSKPEPKAELIKVFCLDDSPAVHTLMKSILKIENGFEIVASADNILDLQRQSKALQDADLITVNLQTSDTSSLEYLQKNQKEFHPPALIVCSETKEQTQLIEEASKLGDFEFVEKPVLNHLAEQGEVIRAKLKTLLFNRRNNVLSIRAFDQFKNCRPIGNPSEKVRVVVGGLSHLGKIAHYLRELKGDQPPVYLFVESMNANLGAVAAVLKRLSGKPCTHRKTLSEGLKVNEIGLYDFKSFFSKVVDLHRTQKASIAVLGYVGSNTGEQILSWPGAHLMLEDLGNGEAAPSLKTRVEDIYPASSFAFLSSEYLQDK